MKKQQQRYNKYSSPIVEKYTSKYMKVRLKTSHG